MPVAVLRAEGRSSAEGAVEIVERKGLGHPDSICDALAEELSLDLSRFYREHAGIILHHNVDKALLVGGASRPRFGGGEVLQPIRIFLAGRATLECDGITVPVQSIAERATRGWLARNLHALDARRHVILETLVRPGSVELVELFEQRRGALAALANDTSCGVGHAPLSELERAVLAVEERLSSAARRGAAPAFGEDVKVMAIRRDGRVKLVVACAMVDAALNDLTDYRSAVQRAAELSLEAAAEHTSLPVSVEVNAADDVAAGRIYLTVTGTSAEAGDDGQAGRGNRVNGLIAPGRPMTMESVAGKNPVTHVGKLYNLVAGLAADRIAEALPAASRVECRLVSRIGHPIVDPELAEVRLAGVDPDRDREAAGTAEAILRDELEHLPALADELVRGDVRLDRWPLRVRPRVDA